jgi:arsenite-transporting ATPase
MKTIFFTGKGGVGKSTMSAAAAHQLAEKGNKVLAISFDPAHNLGDIFGLTLSHKKKKFTDNLYLQEANLDEAAQEYIKQNTDILTEVYSYTKAFNLDRYFKVLRHSPGVEEYAALTALEKVLRTSDEFDLIVVDTPPTGLTLRIMALPRISITWIDRLRRIRRDILDKRHTIHNISGKFIEEGSKLVYEEKDDQVMRTLQGLFTRYLKVAQHLESDESQIAVVFNPDYLSLRESQRIFTGLDDLKINVDVALNNKYTPGLKEIADEMEAEMFGKMKNPPTLARVPWGAYRRERSYEIEYDLTQLFR